MEENIDADAVSASYKGTVDGRSEEESEISSETNLLRTEPSVTMDYRIRWIRDKVMQFLGLTDNYILLFDSLISENHRFYEDKLLNLLILDLYGVMDLDKKQVFFYKTYKSEVVQEEISVWEERKVEKIEKVEEDKKKEKKGKKGKKSKKGEKSEQSSTAASSVFTSVSAMPSYGTMAEGSDEDYGEDRESEVEEDEGASGDNSSLQWKKKNHAHSTTSLRSIPFVPPPGEEDKYTLTKKVVDKVVEVPVLHVFFGEIDADDKEVENANMFYFMRTSEEGIPSFETYEDCKKSMPKHLIVGSINGNLLPAMNKILVYAFKPLVENQYRGVGAAQQQIEEIHSGAMSDETPMGRANATLSSMLEHQGTAFTRPSNYRRVSVMISKMEESGRLSTNERKSDVSRVRRASAVAGNDEKSLHPKKDEGGADATAKSSAPRKEPFMESSKRDLLNYLDKLTTTVQWTLEHIEGDILLSVPRVSELLETDGTTSPSVAKRRAVEQLEKVVGSWGKHIQKVLDTYMKKVPQGRGPLAEHDYWRDRETGLSMLVEQLKTADVKEILSLLNDAESPIASAFSFFQLELWKHYTEARDNNKFLFTILRYMKLIAESNSFQAIAKALPSLTEGMRMIWVLSKYYCTEDTMAPLLGRVSWQLCQNIMKNLAIETLFKKPLEEILSLTADAHEMMKNWKQSYLHTRESIEESGKGLRWEFDQELLFKETEYISNVCNDLNKIASVLQDFYNIFGAELKSIINDPAQIDDIVKRVEKLIVPLQNADFNVFTKFNKENWEATMSWFYVEVGYLENEAKFYIDECFNVLISAEQALDVLLKFKNIKTRRAIHEQLLMKFDVVMQQFSKEISEVENIFNRGKRNPPLLYYHPPIAGAIFWERQLFHRLKDPVLKFQQIEELKNSELKIMAFQQYLSIAKQMKAFEEIKFNSWMETASAIVTVTMRKSVLKMTAVDREIRTDPKTQLAKRASGASIKTKKSRSKDHGTIGPDGRDSVTTVIEKQFDGIISKPSLDTSASIGSEQKVVLPSLRPKSASRAGGDTLARDRKASTISSLVDKTKVTWKEMLRDGTTMELQLRFEINFNWEVFEIIHEAELLEQLGFELPEIVRNVGIQRDRLRADIEVTKNVIDRYSEILAKLQEADLQLLNKSLRNIEKNIYPGVTRLNWYSLAISDYAVTCEKLLKGLSSIVTQVKQMKWDLDQRIEKELQSYNLFSTSMEQGEFEIDLSPCKTCFLNIEAKRTEFVCAMLKAYNSTSPMLIKLESLVEGTSTGRSPAMQLFYEHYEAKIFRAFILCVVQNLETLNALLSGNKPVFKVDAILVASEVILRPSQSEIRAIILHDVKDLLERFKLFPRWMATTCHECKPVKQANSEEFVTYSFFEDIMSIQIINDRIFGIRDTILKLTADCRKYLSRWKKYRNLWRFDKVQICEKFASENPTLLHYDEKFTFYGTIVEEIDEMRPYFDVSSVRINLIPLLTAIKDHANEWKQILGNHLLTETRDAMNDLKHRIDAFRGDVELVISGLDRFKVIMQSISDIKKLAVQSEVQYYLYQETFRTLNNHSINYAAEDEQLAYKLEEEWNSLYLGALYRATTLESTKDRFCDMTREQIANFGSECSEFAELFENHGPGSVGNDLDAGLKKMEEYGKLIEKMEEKRMDLANAEILFDLEPADYSSFLKIKQDYEGMGMLYEIYRAQKSARDAWSKTLWIDLNPQELMEGMEQFIKEFRRLPKPVRQLNVAYTLEATMKTFKNSVPLFVELKNEAMRERHWEELMNRTGMHFDMEPSRCVDNK